MKAVEKRSHDLKEMNDLGEELAGKLDMYRGISSEARYDKRTTTERYERICLELRNREQLIEAQVNSADKFTTALQEFQIDLTGVEAVILEETPGNDSETLKRQLAELQVILSFSEKKGLEEGDALGKGKKSGCFRFAGWERKGKERKGTLFKCLVDLALEH